MNIVDLALREDKKIVDKITQGARLTGLLDLSAAIDSIGTSPDPGFAP
jgi:hypothetical protein